MSAKRRALGRGLGALIPSAPAGDGGRRPVDVFFRDGSGPRSDTSSPVSRETPPRGEDGSTDESQGEAIGNGHDPRSAQSGRASDVDPEAVDGPDYSGPDLAPVPGARYEELPVGSIRPNPRQPRQVFDDDDMAELVNSIKEIGVLQPVVVRPIPADELEIAAGQTPDGAEQPRFELIMGERRLRATAAAGMAFIPAIIKDTHDDDLLRDALLENLHRSELNALEEAAAYQQLLDDFGCTHDELAARIGRSRPQISNTLRLLKLPPLVQRRVAAGVLSAGHARALLGLADGASMERLAQRIVAEGLSVRSVEEIVTLGGDAAPRARKPRAGGRHPQLDDLAARLSDRLDTRVRISLGQRKGKLTVEFASVEDLNRIIDALGVNMG
ncbi:MAG: ParB/RepB/Spo0J family partition protein [Dermatophilaceae bacterium]